MRPDQFPLKTEKYLRRLQTMDDLTFASNKQPLISGLENTAFQVEEEKCSVYTLPRLDVPQDPYLHRFLSESNRRHFSFHFFLFLLRLCDDVLDLTCGP